MIISELKLFDFRKFHGTPGLSVNFHRGLNAIIGENDSGKTAIIDALKLVLLNRAMSIFVQQGTISIKALMYS